MRPVKILTMVLAGGVGERLYPLTARRCKPVVPFGGNFRIVDFTLMNCVCSDLRQVYILPQYHAQSLTRHGAERWNFLPSELGEYIEMLPPKLRGASSYYRGTADAVYRNLDLLDRHRPDLVLVLSGDHVYRADYRKFIEAHLERDADVTVLSDWVEAKYCSSFGVLTLGPDHRITGFVEKPADPTPYAIDGRCATNLGVYCFRTEFLVEQVIRDSKKNTHHDFGRNILPSCVESARILACPLQAVSPDPRPYWRDVGNIDSYFQSSMDLLQDPPPFELRDPRWPPNSRFHDWLPAIVSATARIGNRRVRGRNIISSGVSIGCAQVVNSVISPRVSIDHDCELEECIVFEGARIGRGARLRRVIVEEDVEIPEGARVGWGRDAREFTISEGGVVIVPASYRFRQPIAGRRSAAAASAARPAAEAAPEPAEDCPPELASSPAPSRVARAV